MAKKNNNVFQQSSNSHKTCYHATREELYCTMKHSMLRTEYVMNAIQPVIDAENEYLTHMATKIGMRRSHIKHQSEFMLLD